MEKYSMVIMKKLIIILLFIPLLAEAQYSHRLTEKAATSILLDIGSITLDAMGDAYFDMGNKELGKFLQAGSTGLLLAQPFLIDFDKRDWMWKLPAYILIRFATFDLIYNTTRDLPYYYQGSTSFYDKTIGEIMPGKMATMPKVLALTVGISLTLRYGQ